LYGVKGFAGHTGEALDRRVSDAAWTYVPSSDGNALWLSASPPRVYVTWDAGERWERVITPSPLTKRLRAIAIAAGRFLLASDTWHRSDDGGATWQVMSAPSGECTHLHARGDDVLAIVAGELHRSHDGGTTWEHVTAASHAVFGPERDTIHAIAGDHVVWTCDGGTTWKHAAPLPFAPQQILVGRAAETFVVFGTQLDPDTKKKCGARRARTTDGGATFTLGPEAKGICHQAALAHPSGRWFHVPFDAQYLQYSDDEGATWASACDEQPQALAVDPSRPRSIYATSWDKLFRISW